MAAGPAESPPASANPRALLSFRLGSEEFGVDILRVQEVRSFETCAHLANTRGLGRGLFESPLH